MSSEKKAAAYERGNRAAAESILEHRESRPRCTVQWALDYQRDQRAEQAAVKARAAAYAAERRDQRSFNFGKPVTELIHGKLKSRFVSSGMLGESSFPGLRDEDSRLSHARILFAGGPV